jgi:serine/threonine protein kinase
MVKEADSFAELIGAIADGAPIDWKRVESSSRLRAGELRAARALAAMRDTSGSEARDAGGEAPPTELVRGFELLEEIGRGAFGSVWRARDRALGREVALKVLVDEKLTEEQRAKFLREARELARCESNNVVRIHSVEEREGRLELCLELIDGDTLKQMVDKGGVRSADEAARIGIELCRALATIHALGLVHCDVKPANVMRGPGGRIVLLDFGLAHATDLSGPCGLGVPGTPLFIAPELLRGRGTLDGRIDLYALGVTLYWLVTAKWPHEATTRDEILEKIEHEPPVPLIDRRPDLPAEFIAIVEHALQRDPARRVATAGEMEKELRGFLAHSGGGEGGGTGVEQNRWKRVAWIAAACVVLVVGGLIAAFSMNRATLPNASIELSRSVSSHGDSGPWIKLEPGSELHESDGLVAEVTSSVPIHVFAFLLDDSDECTVLFPSPDTTRANPLPSGVVDLPGVGKKGEERAWTVDRQSSEYRILFFVSDRANDPLEHLWNVAIYEVTRGAAKTQARPPTREEIAKLRDDLRHGADKIARDTGSQLVEFTYKSPAK